ncbi:porin [Aquibaculum arenosum]|uniref:Porin n=1 Tax=Aquibaculum arenosum TaxID=3032591 RepID=A0ABT5YJ29_9PROT|nr:porin [Fodinicurvata sp. CAU 1616]MDF2094913.1 porin [Fodinicurvata sp. CAU 1616]
MKKMLLAATAAAVVGGVAVAGSPVQAQEAEGFQLQIGGFYNALAIVRDNDDVGGDKIRSYDFNQRGRYTIQGSQTLDNGMTIGFHTQYEMQAGMNNNRSYVYADGGFGRVQFGTMYSAPYLMHVSPPTAGWGIDDTGHSQGMVPTNGVGFAATPTYYINRSMNFTYMTPRFAGFQAGFTFAPDQRNRENMNNRVATNLSAQNRSAGLGLGDLQNIVGLSANYQQSFDEVSVGLSAGFETGEWNQGAKNIIQAAGINDKRAWTYALGGSVGFGGLNAGVAYNFDNNGIASYRTHQVTAGLTYTVDGFTFGPSFGANWSKGRNQAGGNPRSYIYDFGARYAFAPGVNLVGSIQHGDFKSNINANDGKATAGLFGVQMNF